MNPSLATPIPCLLLVEDQDDDVFFFRRALTQAAVVVRLAVARDGSEAIDYLDGRPPFTDRISAPLPSLVLLDLKMPRMNGFDVLNWLRARPEFSKLPVIVFSTSDLPSDIERAMELGANDYRVKPNDFDDLVEFVKEIAQSLRTASVAA